MFNRPDNQVQLPGFDKGVCVCVCVCVVCVCVLCVCVLCVCVIAPLCHYVRASLVAQMVKNLPAMQETETQSLGWEDLLEKGMATHTSSLA